MGDATLWENDNPPSSDFLLDILDKPAVSGVGLHDSTDTSAHIAYLKKLIAGTNMSITDNGDGTVTFDAASSGGGSAGDANTVSASLTFTGIIAVDLTGITLLDDWAPANLATSSVIRLTGTGNAVNITGITGGASGRILILENKRTAPVTICDGNGTGNLGATSLAANRFLLSDVNIATNYPADISIPSGGAAIIFYDATASRWKCVAANIQNVIKARTSLTTIVNIAGVAAVSVLKFTAKANSLRVGDVFEFKVWGYNHFFNNSGVYCELRMNAASLGADQLAEGNFTDTVTRDVMFELTGYAKVHSLGAKNPGTGGTLTGGQVLGLLPGGPSGHTVSTPVDTTSDQIIELVMFTSSNSVHSYLFGGYIKKIF